MCRWNTCLRIMLLICVLGYNANEKRVCLICSPQWASSAMHSENTITTFTKICKYIGFTAGLYGKFFSNEAVSRLFKISQHAVHIHCGEMYMQQSNDRIKKYPEPFTEPPMFSPGCTVGPVTMMSMSDFNSMLELLYQLFKNPVKDPCKKMEDLATKAQDHVCLHYKRTYPRGAGRIGYAARTAWFIEWTREPESFANKARSLRPCHSRATRIDRLRSDLYKEIDTAIAAVMLTQSLLMVKDDTRIDAIAAAVAGLQQQTGRHIEAGIILWIQSPADSRSRVLMLLPNPFDWDCKAPKKAAKERRDHKKAKTIPPSEKETDEKSKAQKERKHRHDSKKHKHDDNTSHQKANGMVVHRWGRTFNNWFHRIIDAAVEDLETTYSDDHNWSHVQNCAELWFWFRTIWCWNRQIFSKGSNASHRWQQQKTPQKSQWTKVHGTVELGLYTGPWDHRKLLIRRLDKPGPIQQRKMFIDAFLVCQIKPSMASTMETLMNRNAWHRGMGAVHGTMGILDIQNNPAPKYTEPQINPLLAKPQITPLNSQSLFNPWVVRRACCQNR